MKIAKEIITHVFVPGCLSNQRVKNPPKSFLRIRTVEPCCEMVDSCSKKRV